MRSTPHARSTSTLGPFFRQLEPGTRLRLLLLILALCVLACLLGIYSVPDIMATGRTYLAAAQTALVTTLPTLLS